MSVSGTHVGTMQHHRHLTTRETKRTSRAPLLHAGWSDSVSAGPRVHCVFCVTSAHFRAHLRHSWRGGTTTSSSTARFPADCSAAARCATAFRRDLSHHRLETAHRMHADRGCARGPARQGSRLLRVQPRRVPSHASLKLNSTPARGVCDWTVVTPLQPRASRVAAGRRTPPLRSPCSCTAQAAGHARDPRGASRRRPREWCGRTTWPPWWRWRWR